jgi:ATP-dependent Lon protease
MFCYLPGWEIPKMDNKFFSKNFGLITDYMAEAFHYMFKHNSEYLDIINRRLKLGKNVQGRDEIAIKKTLTGLIKIVHPSGEPSESEFNDLVEYAIEVRRRVKEQMNKRKPDDEFALINLSYYNSEGKEIVVYCPESKNVAATQNPRNDKKIPDTTLVEPIKIEVAEQEPVNDLSLKEKRVKILYGDTGYSYEKLFKHYLVGAKEVTVEDPYIRQKHQIINFVRLCELIKIGDCTKINLLTGADDETQQRENMLMFEQLADSLIENGVTLSVQFSEILHDREIKINNGWNIKMGRGLDYFQSLSGNFFQVGANDLDLRPCLETNFDFYRGK